MQRETRVSSVFHDANNKNDNYKILHGGNNVILCNSQQRIRCQSRLVKKICHI